MRHTFVVAFLLAPAAAVTSVKSGDWNDPGVWDSGVPKAGGSITIALGHTTIYNQTQSYSI